MTDDSQQLTTEDIERLRSRVNKLEQMRSVAADQRVRDGQITAETAIDEACYEGLCAQIEYLAGVLDETEERVVN